MDKRNGGKLSRQLSERQYEDCAMRYKVKENIIRKKTAEEARQRALSEQIGEAANAAAAGLAAALAAAQSNLANAGDEVDDIFGEWAAQYRVQMMGRPLISSRTRCWQPMLRVPAPP